MGASIWIKAIRGYLHFLCGSWLFFDMRQKEQASPTNVGPIEVQIDQRDSEEGQPAGQRCCQIQWWTPTWGLVAGLRFLRSYSNWWDMTGQAPWFRSFVPGDVGGCITMSEALGYSTLLVSTACDIQLALACPHIHPQEKKYSGSRRIHWALEKTETGHFSLFMFNLNTWIKHEWIEPIHCEHSLHGI